MEKKIFFSILKFIKRKALLFSFESSLELLIKFLCPMSTFFVDVSFKY